MTEENQSSAVRKHNNKWRVVDIVVAAIIAVASGVIFWGWDIVCTAPLALFEAVTPGFEGLLNAFWLFAGPLAAIIVRKPGAALFAETLAAALELTMGNQWGVGGSLIVGIVQGLGAEIGLAIFAYKKWDLLSTTISGALAGVGCGLYLLAYQSGLERATRQHLPDRLRHFRRGARRRGDVPPAGGHRQDRRARPLRIRSYAGTGLIVRCKQIPHHIKVVRDFLVMAHRMTTAYETTA